MIDAAEIARLATEPIPGAARTGESARYENEFQTAETEVGKIGSLSGGDVDWKLVAANTTTVLASKSKDLLAATWLARAWYHLHGMPGLAGGLQLLQGLVTTFWDDLHPGIAKLRARRQAVQWLGEGMAPLVQADKAGMGEMGQCRDLAVALNDALAPRLEGDTGLGPLVRALNQRIEGGQADAAEAAGAAGDASAEAEPAAASDGASAPAGAPGPKRVGPIAGRDEALKRLREVAQWFQRAEPHSPIGYLLERASRWGGMGFKDLFSELFEANQQAQGELFTVLGIKNPEPPT
jgi:type VI secretion system protein VasJ